jgi:signal peptidase complex subunit 2
MAESVAPAVVPLREEIKVNNASLIDLKNACDDALKRVCCSSLACFVRLCICSRAQQYLSRPDLYKPDYTHTDVRLALGWLAVIVAGGTGYYGWKTEFEESKPIVWVGVLLCVAYDKPTSLLLNLLVRYFALTTAQTLYAYFVEGSTVFVGKRKTLDKRVGSTHFLFVCLGLMLSLQIVTDRMTISSRTDSSAPPPKVGGPCPSYALEAHVLRTASGGKALLGKDKHVTRAPYSQFFDAAGVMDQEGFEAWVGELVTKASA